MSPPNTFHCLGGLGLIRFLLSCLIAVAILYAVQPRTAVSFNQAAAVGADTIDYYAHNGDYAVHCGDATDIANCLAGVEYRALEHNALWLGNSQLHAINQLKQDEVSASHLLHYALLEQNWDLITLSQPNANLQEHYILFEYWLLNSGIDLLLLPVVFDDLREDGLRDTIKSLLGSEAIQSGLKSTEIGRILLNSTPDSIADPMISSRETWQVQSEALLNDVLASHSPLWEKRSTLRSAAIFALYRLRNSLFGISATSKRKMLPGPYANNLAALQALLQRAQEQNIIVLLYIAPIRQDVELPYDQDQYVNFIASVTQIAQATGAYYFNLDQLVDPADWGTTGSIAVGGSTSAGIDFMHFAAGGHKTLSEKLHSLIIDVIDSTASR